MLVFLSKCKKNEIDIFENEKKEKDFKGRTIRRKLLKEREQLQKKHKKNKKLMCLMLVTGAFWVSSCGRTKQEVSLDRVRIKLEERLRETEKESETEEVDEEMTFQTYSIEDTVETSFMSWRIEEVAAKEYIEPFLSKDGWKFVEVSIYMKNTTGENRNVLDGDVEVYLSDFSLYLGELPQEEQQLKVDLESVAYPFYIVGEDHLTEQYVLKEEAVKKLFFLVPNQEKEFMLIYQETYQTQKKNKLQENDQVQEEKPTEQTHQTTETQEQTIKTEQYGVYFTVT